MKLDERKETLWPPFAVFMGGSPPAYEVWTLYGRRVAHNLPECWARVICSALNREMENPGSMTANIYRQEED